MKATCGYITDIGRNPRRKRNEDALLVMPEKGIYLVADGVGGRRGGEVASRTVVETFEEIFSQEVHDDRALVLLGAIDLCNQKIHEESINNREIEGMASTVALVSVAGDLALVAHVGDSRVYRFDTQGLICLTEDHSEVNDALRSGLITEDQAQRHPRRNVINRAVGAEPEVEPELVRIVLDDWTSLLICTDGVTRHLADEEIEALLRTGLHPQTICSMIRQQCHERGADDNLTAILIDFGERYYEEDPEAGQTSIAIPEDRPAAADRIEISLADRLAAPLSSEGQSDSADDDNGYEDGDDTTDDGAVEWTDSDARLDDPDVESESESRHPLTALTVGRLAEYEDIESDADGSAEAKAGLSGMSGKRSGRLGLLLIPLMIGLMIGVLTGAPIRAMIEQALGWSGDADRAQPVEQPSDPEVRAAFARHREGASDEARQQLNALLVRRPDYPEACYYLGVIEYEQGRYEEALSRLQQAVQLDPRLPNVRVRLAMVYISLGQVRTARDVLQQVITPANAAKPGESSSPGRPVGKAADGRGLDRIWVN